MYSIYATSDPSKENEHSLKFQAQLYLQQVIKFLSVILVLPVHIIILIIIYLP